MIDNKYQWEVYMESLLVFIAIAIGALAARKGSR